MSETELAELEAKALRHADTSALIVSPKQILFLVREIKKLRAAAK